MQLTRRAKHSKHPAPDKLADGAAALPRSHQALPPQVLPCLLAVHIALQLAKSRQTGYKGPVRHQAGVQSPRHKKLLTLTAPLRCGHLKLRPDKT